MARIIPFEGRSISVPDDATDDEVAEILEASSPAPAPKAETPGFFERLGNKVVGAGEFVSGMVADTFGDKPASVLQDKVLESPAGMTPDVNLDANRDARNRSRNPNSVMFTKANATDAGNAATARGAEIMAKEEARQQAVRDMPVPEMTAATVGRDVLAGSQKILPTFAKGVADIASMATAGSIGDETSARIEHYMKGIDKVIASDRSKVQKTKFEQDMADDNVSIADAILNNKGSLADQILPTLGSMILPLGAAGAAGKLAQVGKVAKGLDAAAKMARIGKATEAAVIATTVLQNASDTFNTVMDQGGSLSDAYVAAGITAPFTAIAGKLTGGGAEMALAKRLYSGRMASAAGAVRQIAGASGKEASQEIIEQTGQSTGEAVGLGQDINPIKMGKEVAVAGALGGIVGGGANIAGMQGDIQKPPTPIASALDIARSKGFLTPDGTAAAPNGPLAAPKVEDQPTTPVAPTVAATGLQSILQREGLIGDKATEAPAAKAPSANPTPAADPATPQVPTAPSDVAGPADVTAKPVASGSLSNPAPAIPPGTDPRADALAAIEKTLAESRARQDAAAQEWLAKEKADADAKKAAADKVASTGSNYQQKVADTVQPDGGAVPVPMQAATVVETAKAVASKNTDLADQKTYPTKVLYGIINSPDAGPELLDAARTELERRKGNPIGPTVSMQTTSTLSPQAQTLQQKMRSGQNANNGNLATTQNATTPTAYAARASVGVDSEQKPSGQSSVGTDVSGRTVSAAEGTGASTGLPVATAESGSGTPTGVGRAQLRLAPQADKATILNNQLAVKKAKNVVIQPVEDDHPLTEEQSIVSHMVGTLGKTLTWVERSNGPADKMPEGWVNTLGGKHIFLDVNSSKPLLEIVMHEGTHGLPSHIRGKLRDYVNSKVSVEGRSKFLRKYDYEGDTESQQDEEVLAYVAQNISRKPEFLSDLKTALGNKDFSAFVSHVLKKFSQLMGGKGQSQFDSEFLGKHVSDVAEVHKKLVEAYTQAMQEQGLTPDADVVDGGPAFATKQETESGEKRQYKLDVARDDRTVGAKASVSAAEVEAITKDATELGLNNSQIATLIESARDTRKRFPPKAGWAPIEANGVEAKKDDDGNVKLDKKGNPQVKVTWKTIAYAFNVPVGAKKSGQQMDMVHVGKVADQFTKLVNGIYDRANAGDKNAQTIVGHQTWYRNVAAILRQEFGAQGDLFADLLGATSPNTPVDTNWRFAIEVLTRFSKGEFDAEMKAFTDYVDGGGQPSKFPGAKIRQASGKLYGMNSKNSMLALADLWRAVEAGTAPKARNFALNLIGQSNMATIDVWAARMLRRAAGMVRGTDLPRIPTVAEQGVTGNWNTNTTAVTGEFGFGAAVLDRVSADLAKKGIDLSPPDLQALAWFAEKELWTEKNWTSAQGEGGSFEERIEDTPTSRYLMGFSVQQGDIQPEESAVTLAQARLLAQLRGDDSVISARVLPSYGLFMGKPEEALDLEWTVKKGQHSTALVMAEAAAIAKDRTQQAIFISRVLSPNEEHPNARPGAEVYFKKNIGIDRVKAVMDSFTTKGLDGFTLAVDPRAKPSSRPGQEFIGLRIQYIPEFDSVTPENVDAVMVERRAQLQAAVAELSANGDVAFASVYKYDTEVVSGENYDEYIDRGVAGRYSQTGSEVRSGQSVRERLERAATRVQSDAGQNGSGGLPDASRPLAFANKQRGDDRGRAGDQGRQADDDGTQASKRTAAQKGLAPLKGYPTTKAHEGPDAKLVSVAQAYAKANGITLKRQSEYAEIDVDRSTRLADAYAAMPHAPQDPKVKEAYANLIKQTVAQYKALEKAGYKFWLYDGDSDPYDTNPWNAMRDLRTNQSMGVFSTVAGFGSDESFDPASNPLLGDTGIKWPFGSPNGKLKPVLANDLFRAVHDAFGHGLEGTGFRANGEENAWQAHVRLFTGSAVGAITSETRGQNSWLNYGPAGEKNRTAGLFDTTFADQKTGLMPSWTWNEGRVGSEVDPALDADITLDIPLDNGKTAKMTVNAQRYITQLDAREDALRMVKECMV